MKIGFDAKRAFFNRTGLGNYSRSLITALIGAFPANEYYLFTPKIDKEHSCFNVKVKSNVKILFSTTKIFSSIWRSFFIKRQIKSEKLDVYHGLSAELPFGKKPLNTKYIVTIHDLIFERFPKLYNNIDRQIYRMKTQHACKIADYIIATSEQTKRDLIEFYHIEASKIFVVYQTCHPSFSIEYTKEMKDKIATKYDLPSKFLLTVGTIETRKNALVILKAMQQLSEEVNLVIIGKKTAYFDEISSFIIKNNLQNRIKFLHQVAFEDLPIIYQLSQIFIYPSKYEGFGIPILEALKSKIPVIAATGSCLEEVGGPNSLYFPPDDFQTLASHIGNLWKDEVARQKQIEAGERFSEQFNEENFAHQTKEIYYKK